MKISFQLIVWNDDYVLEPMLKSIMPFGEVYVCEGPVGYFAKQGFGTSTDRTNEILHQYLPEEHIKHGVWSEKDEMVNVALGLMPGDTDFVFEVDADEIYKSDDLAKIVDLLESDNYDSMAFRFISFYGGFSRIMGGFEYNFETHRIQRYYPGCQWKTHRPPTILAPDGKPWREHRHLGHIATSDMGIFVYHYSYVWASQMKRKALYYHARGGTIDDYFQRVYLPWVLGNPSARQIIEDEFDGVHDWEPVNRGECRTLEYLGEHPKEIIKVMPELLDRFDDELRAYR